MNSKKTDKENKDQIEKISKKIDKLQKKIDKYHSEEKDKSNFHIGLILLGFSLTFIAISISLIKPKFFPIIQGIISLVIGLIFLIPAIKLIKSSVK